MTFQSRIAANDGGEKNLERKETTKIPKSRYVPAIDPPEGFCFKGLLGNLVGS